MQFDIYIDFGNGFKKIKSLPYDSSTNVRIKVDIEENDQEGILQAKLKLGNDRCVVMMDEISIFPSGNAAYKLYGYQSNAAKVTGSCHYFLSKKAVILSR